MTSDEKVVEAIEALADKEDVRTEDWSLKGRFDSLGLYVEPDTITNLAMNIAMSSKATMEALMEKGVDMHEAAIAASVTPLIMGMELYKELLVKQ